MCRANKWFVLVRTLGKRTRQKVARVSNAVPPVKMVASLRAANATNKRESGPVPETVADRWHASPLKAHAARAMKTAGPGSDVRQKTI